MSIFDVMEGSRASIRFRRVILNMLPDYYCYPIHQEI
jgi:hypothetical protein